MRDTSDTSSQLHHWSTHFSEVPWQIWVVVTLLAVEGLGGNLPAIPTMPVAAIWFLAKCLFIAGLLLRWRWVFIVYLIVGVGHVLAFAGASPFIAFLNLTMVLLVASSVRSYFPKVAMAPSGEHEDRLP